MKRFLRATLFSLKVGVSRPLSTENCSECSMMALACGDISKSCDQDTTVSAIHIIEFTKAKYSGTYFCGNPWLYIVEEI